MRGDDYIPILGTKPLPKCRSNLRDVALDLIPPFQTVWHVLSCLAVSGPNLVRNLYASSGLE